MRATSRSITHKKELGLCLQIFCQTGPSRRQTTGPTICLQCRDQDFSLRAYFKGRASKLAGFSSSLSLSSRVPKWATVNIIFKVFDMNPRNNLPSLPNAKHKFSPLHHTIDIAKCLFQEHSNAKPHEH